MSELSPKVIDALVNAYAMAKGVSVEQARSIIEPLLTRPEYKNDLEKFLRDVGLMGDVLSKVPPESREAITKAIVDKMAEEEEDEGINVKAIKKMAIEIAMVNAILNAALGGTNNGKTSPELEMLRERNEQLERELREIKELLRQKEEEEKERRLRETIKELKDEIKNIREEIVSIKNNPNIEPEVKKSAIEKLAELADQLEKEMEILGKLGFKVVSKSEPEIASKRIELEREKNKAINDLLTKHIGPALADLIRNPEKIMRLIRYARMAVESPNYMAQQTQSKEEPIEELPSLTKYLEEVGEGGSGQEEG